MVLNVVFLVGGAFVGYLLRGEVERRKSKKAWSTALSEGIKVAEKWINELNSKEEIESDEESTWEVVGQDDATNSKDETIQL